MKMAICRLLAILLCITNWISSDGVVVTEANLQEILSRKITIRDRTSPITVGELYGPLATPEDFNPGELFLGFLDLPAVDRHLDYTDANPVASDAISYVITQNVAKEVTKLTSDPDHIILVRGDPLSGKTTAMRIIQHAAANKLRILTIFVDLPKLVNPSNMDSLSLDFILKATIDEKYLQFVKNLIQVNPLAFKIFFDGVDQVPHARDKILSVLQETVTQNIPIVMSTSSNIRQQLASHGILPRSLHLPRTLSLDEFFMLAQIYWSKQFNIPLDLNAETPLSSHFQTYAIALYLLLTETPLINSLAAREVVLEYTLNNHVLQPLPTALQYFQGEFHQISPKQLLKLSDRMRFLKISYYDKLLENHDLPIDVYGPQALNRIIVSDTIKSEFASALKFSNEQIQKNTQDAYKFLAFRENGIIDFVHDEYKRYFAAKYILHSLKTDNPLVECFKEVVTSVDHIFVLEFINSAINDKDYIEVTNKIPTFLSHGISSSAEFAETVADNTIEHRLDNMCYQTLQAMDKFRLIEYLNAPTILQSRNKYSFGMLSEEHENIYHEDYYPRKTPWQYGGTRRELIIHLELGHAQTVIRNSEIKLHRGVGLIHAAKQSFEQFRQYVVAYNKPYIIENLNKAVWESMRSLGPDSRPIINMLCSMGANPRAINVNGRTLAHEAARWHNAQLFKYIHKNLEIPLIDSPDANGRTILLELLDHGMPFNGYEVEGAWAAMDYLTQHGDLSINKAIINSLVPECLRYHPNDESILGSTEPYLDLLKFHTHDDVPVRRQEAIKHILSKYIGFDDLDIPIKNLEIRRKVIIKKLALMADNVNPVIAAIMAHSNEIDQLTLSEIIISHGMSPKIFTPKTYLHYLETVKTLLEKEGQTLNRAQADRVALALAKNIVATKHVDDVFKILQSWRVRLPEETLYDMKLILSRRINDDLPIIPLNHNNLESIISQTPYDLEPDIDMDEILELQLSHRESEYDEGIVDDENLESFACNYAIL